MTEHKSSYSWLVVAASLTFSSPVFAIEEKNFLQQYKLLAPTAGAGYVIKNGDTVILSLYDNSESSWDKFASLTVGSGTDGALLIDNRAIQTQTGSIGTNASSGMVELTNQAQWILEGGNLVLGTGDGNGTLHVFKGSSISGIGELRVGEFAGKAQGYVLVDGDGSSISSNWMVVGDQGRGAVDITNGGKISILEWVNIGYVGNTPKTARNGYGVVTVDGHGSMLDVDGAILLGGFATTANDATGILTVSNGATVNAGTYIYVGVGAGSTGILNIGVSPGEITQQAGYVNTPQVYLGGGSTGTTAQLNFNHITEDYGFSAAITGRGEVNHLGTGTTLLTGNNSYSGKTVVEQGVLRAGSVNAFSKNSDFVVGKDGTLDLGGFDQTIKSLVLSGTLNTQRPSQTSSDHTPASNVLTIRGNYHGDDGVLIYNAAEHPSEYYSTINLLHVLGDTSGTTRVKIQEIGALAVNDLNGVKVVHVEGDSAGTFVRDGRLIAGGHEYSLHRGVSTDNEQPAQPDSPGAAVPDSNHWYLTNRVWVGPGGDFVIPPDTTGGGGIVYRPEIGGYLANQAAANTLFNTRLHDRLGETQYIDPITGEEKVTSMWMRHTGGHMRFDDTTGQMKTQNNRYVLQIGGDIAQWSSDGLDRWHLGVMAGYGHNTSRTTSAITRYQARGRVAGYSTGLYATWYANEADKSGAYVDSWALYNWFDNQVKGDELATEKYHSDGMTSSLEAGYTFRLGSSKNTTFWLQPKGQLTWMDVSARDHYEENGTRVKENGRGNLQSRLGLRASLQGYSKLDEGTGRLFQPFVEANWIHNTENFSVLMNEYRGEINGTKNIAEVKLGVEAKLNQRLHLWGNVGQQIGAKGYSDTEVNLGVKFAF